MRVVQINQRDNPAMSSSPSLEGKETCIQWLHYMKEASQTSRPIMNDEAPKISFTQKDPVYTKISIKEGGIFTILDSKKTLYFPLWLRYFGPFHSVHQQTQFLPHLFQSSKFLPYKSLFCRKIVISWLDFKRAFLEEYYQEEAQLCKQQEFTKLSQKAHYVTIYTRDFMRMKQFEIFCILNISYHGGSSLD